MVSEQDLAPTQTSRLESLEADVQELQNLIPELQTSLEDKLTDMMRNFEESQCRIVLEQSKSKVELYRNQEEMKNSMMVVMAKLKNISNRVKVSSEREDVTSKESQLFVEGGGFDVPNTILKRTTSRPSQEVTNWKCRRPEYPLFSGDDPDGWVAKSERCHKFYRLGEAEILGTAVLGLEGDATWRALKRMMLRRFRGQRGGSLMEQ